MTLAAGNRRIPFRLKNVDSNVISSEELSRDARGMAIIFSCNHCPYVLAWEDRMIALGNTYLPQGIRFVLINANDPVRYPEDGFPEMEKRAKTKGYPFPYLHDEDQLVARAYGATRTPEVFLFDSAAVLRYHGRIDDHYEDPGGVRSHDLRDAIEAVISGKDPATSETSPIGCTIKWKA